MSARDNPARRCMGVIMTSDSRIEIRKSKLTPTLGNVGAAAAAGTGCGTVEEERVAARASDACDAISRLWSGRTTEGILVVSPTDSMAFQNSVFPFASIGMEVEVEAMVDEVEARGCHSLVMPEDDMIFDPPKFQIPKN